MIHSKIYVCIIFLFLPGVACKSKQPLQPGLYDGFDDRGGEWWKLRIRSDSTFVFEDWTQKKYDSTEEVGIMSGRWKIQNSLLYLYEPYDPNFDSVYDYKFMFHTKWKYKIDRIYPPDRKSFSRLCFKKVQ
jgi:hypothetical protein